MDSTLSGVGAVPAAHGLSPWARRRIFYTGLPIAMALVVIVGFAPTYYLKTAFGTPPLSPIYHVHGLLFSLWLVFIVVQPALVAARRVNLHRTLGVAGGVVAALMMPAALAVSLDLGRRGTAPQGIAPLSFLIVPLATLVVFPALIGAAFWWRRSPEIHKRLMLIGTLELVPAGFGRWPGLTSAGPVGFFGLADLFVLAMVAFDVATRGRPHRATVWGGLFLIASQVGRVVISGTGPWLAFAGWLVG